MSLQVGYYGDYLTTNYPTINAIHCQASLAYVIHDVWDNYEAQTMTTSSIQSDNLERQEIQDNNRHTSTIFALLGLGIFAILGIWGGLPPESERLAFIGGMVFLIAMTILSGAAVWYLMLRPLPANHKIISEPLVNPVYRQVMAILLAISAISLTVGGVWDEIWHRDFGLPFGEDLFWRPHLLMYGAFLIVIFLAVFGWFTILRRGRGTLQQRFRADPILSYITLLGTFLIYSLPFDPLWHMIYGADISAWSVPHIILGGTFLITTILFTATQLSILQKRRWQSILSFNLNDGLMIVILSFLAPPLLQLLVLEWSMTGGTVNPNSVVAQRPDWMLPTLLTLASVFIVTFVTHALKRVGVGTVILVIAFVFRSLLITLADNVQISAIMWALVIPPAIGIDIYYAYVYSRQGKIPSWIGVALAATITSTVIGLPLINRWLVIPEIAWLDLLTVVPAILIAALAASWMGSTVGNFVSQVDNRAEANQTQLAQVRRFSPVAFAAYLVFLLWFIMTAIPPVEII